MSITATDYEIQRTLTVSTLHLSDKSRRLLEEGQLDVLTIPHGYGWIVWVDEDHVMYNPQEIEADIWAILLVAKAEACQWVRFDCDGPILGGLAQYEWEADAPVEPPHPNELLKVLRDLIAWADAFGGWDTAVWRRARLAAGLEESTRAEER